MPDMSLGGTWLVIKDEVNMDDLIRAVPGAIIRVRAPDSVRYIPDALESYDRLAGLISDG